MLPGVKVAVTVRVAVSVTVHWPPATVSHPVKLAVLPLLGAALKTTDIPAAKFDEQLVPQSMPTGALVTLPDPVPALTTARPKVCAAIVNGMAFEVPADVTTVTCASPPVAMSAARMLACNCVLPRTVVVRPAPFHRTVDPDPKFVPVTVSTKPAVPATPLVGDRDVIVGAGGAGGAGDAANGMA